MKNSKKIIVTGGTGFLGQHLIPLLKKHHDVFVISRSGKTEIFGDLTKWDGHIQYDILSHIQFDAMIHLGGRYDLRATEVECGQSNIMGTSTALKICEKLKIPLFMNASSVAAAINTNRKKVFPEDLNFQNEFPDFYSHSKAHVEQMLKNWMGNSIQKIINLRLGVLIGDSETGSILRIDGPYHMPMLLEPLKKQIELFPTPLLLPGHEQTRLPLVPVDKAATAIQQLLEKALNTNTFSSGFTSLHLTPKKGIKVADLYRKTFDYLNINHKGIILVDSIPAFILGPLSEIIFQFPREELNYLLKFPIYDSSATQEILGEDWCPEFNEYESLFWRGYEKIMENC